MIGIIIACAGIALNHNGMVGGGGGMIGSIISDIIILRIAKNNCEANFAKIRAVMLVVGLALGVGFFAIAGSGILSFENIGWLRHVISLAGTMGIGMGVASVISLVFMQRYKKNPEKVKQVEAIAKETEILSNDERNVTIRRRATAASWYVTFWATVIVGVVSWLYDFNIITWLICGLALLHICCLYMGLWVYGKKM